jgi:hypothetical protein
MAKNKKTKVLRKARVKLSAGGSPTKIKTPSASKIAGRMKAVEEGRISLKAALTFLLKGTD